MPRQGAGVVWLGVCVLACTAGSAGAAGEPADVVGELEAPEYVRVEGAKAFTSESINAALFSDHEVICASHPAAPRKPFVEVVRKKLLLGYKHLGFPDALVDAGFDDAGKLTLKVSEGPRYAAGGTRVEGNAAVATEEISRAIAEVRAGWEERAVPGEEPKWAGFDAASIASVEQGVEQAYARAGRLFPKYETDVVPQHGKRVAQLVVKVLDEGPLCVLDRVKVTGCERSTPEDVIKASGLRVGETLTSDLMGRAYVDLIESGRLRAVFMTYSPSGERLGGIEVTVRIVEYEKAPPLSVPPTREERACLRFRKWLIEFFSGRCDGDLVERAGVDGEIGFVVSPRRGLLVNMGAFPGFEVTRLRLLAEGGRLVALSGVGAGKLTVPLDDNMLGLLVTASPEEPGEAEASFTMGYSASLGKQDSSPQSDSFGKGVVSSGDGCYVYASLKTAAWVGALKIETDLHPAAFVGLTLKKDARFSFDGGSFVIAGGEQPGGVQLEVDEATGRLISFSFDTDEGDDETILARVEPDGFARARERMLADAAAEEERYDPETPWPSAVAFAVDAFVRKELIESILETELPAAVVLLPVLRRKLADAVTAAGRTFEERVTEGLPERDADEESFYVPSSPDFLKGRPPLGVMFAPLAWSVAHVFPPKAWPRVAGREIALVALGETRHVEADLRALHGDDRIGPAGCLGLAYLTSMLDPRYAVSFAEKGLGELALAGIRKDCRTVLELDFVSRLAEAAVQALRGVDRATVAAAAALLPEEESRALTDTFAAIDGRADARPADVAMLALEAYWEVSFEDWIRSGFAPFYEDYSRMALARRDPRTAAMAAAKAISLDPGRAQAYRLRAMAFAAGGVHRSAIDDFGKAIELEPETAPSWIGRARSLAATGDADGAKRDLGKAMELDPKEALAWHERGMLFQASGDAEAAGRDFTKAIELEPRLAVSWYGRGKVLAASGDAEGAERDFTKAVELAPKAADPRLERGRLRARSGNAEGARRDLRKAAELDPKGEVGRAARKALRDLEAGAAPAGTGGPATRD
ncbi:MAG: tetratricopeptide repeat protein [Planctomycetota bacterium]|jgi:tetratricopeptide (TPR) repeat protein